MEILILVFLDPTIMCLIDFIMIINKCYNRKVTLLKGDPLCSVLFILLLW